MFEKRTKKQRTMIYVVISIIVTTLLALMHYYIQGWPSLFVILGAVVEFFCIFYILYLPLKMKKD